MFDASELGKTIAEIFISGFFQAFNPVLTIFIIPALLWVVLPGTITRIVLRRRDGYAIGAFIGLIGAFTIGPWAT